jgi:hypothetical protein
MREGLKLQGASLGRYMSSVSVSGAISISDSWQIQVQSTQPFLELEYNSKGLVDDLSSIFPSLGRHRHTFSVV